MKKFLLTFSLFTLCFTTLYSFSAQTALISTSQTNNLKQVYIERSVPADVEYDPVDLNTLKTIRDNTPLGSPLKIVWADEANAGIWEGVKWSDIRPRKVVQLTIKSKNLLSLDVTTLSSLESLDCSSNSLVALNISGLTKLKYLTCNYNRLAFSQLPLSLPITGGAYAFSPQNNLYEDRAIVAGETIDYSYERLVNGFSTVYTWYKDQVKIEGTDQSGKFTPTQEGFYACKMTNGSFPLLTLFTSNVKVGISEDFFPQDVSVLKAMRDNAPSNSVLKTEWADESKIGTWNGVTWTELKPRRVKGLLLQYKSLTEMNIADLGFLENLECEYNNIPMSKLPIKLPVSGGTYRKFPQGKIFKELSISIGTKIDYSSETMIQGKTSIFTWYGCGIKINEADQSGSYVPTREGLYYCEIYSPYWGITETTNLVKVGNPVEYDPTNVNALKAIRDNAPASSPLKTRWANDSQIAYWIGVEWSGMASKKVISLDLIDTNLESLDISQLTDIQRFFCDLNNLKSLDVRGLNHLVNFSCSGNKLRFSTFLIDSKFSSIKYKTLSPQNSWTDERTISLGEIIDFSSEVSVNGVSTIYTWYRNNIKIEGTNQSGIYTPTQEGYYYCMMSNSSFPDMPIRSPMIKVGNPSDYDPIDVNALKKIRDDAPADSPLKVLWSDEAKVGSWSGVNWSKAVKPYKVESLTVRNSKLTVLDVQPLGMLKTLDCSNNSIKKLDLSSMNELAQIACQSNELYELNISGMESKITYMNCSSNRLTFMNLPRLSTRLCTFLYDTQNPYPEDKTISLGTTIDFSSEAKIEAHNTVYLWYRNNEKITGTDSSGKYTPTQNGYYYCTMTNGRYTPLLIVSNAFKIGPDLGTFYQQDLTTLKTIRDNAPADSPLKTLWGDETAINTWKGVTWSQEIPYRVVSLNISSSKLETLDVTPLSLLQILSCNDNSLTSLKINGLSYLTQLFCTGNKLTMIDLTGTTKVNTLYIYNNKFTFSTLPPRTKGLSYYNNYSYGSQTPYSDSKTITNGEILDYSSQATINGVATKYSWYVGGLKLENTDQSGKFAPIEAGYYTCTMTNASFPELTITTGALKFGEPAEYSQHDIDALKKIRDNSPASSYLRTLWVDETKISSWYGVYWSYVAPRRVISLNVSSLGLENLDVSNLNYLSILDCYNNKLKSLSIAGTRITNLICKFNNIPFSKLPLPLPAYSAETVIEYSPQNLIFDEQNIKLGETIDYSSEASIDGNPTIFTWYQNGVVINNTDQSGKYTPKVEDRFYCVLSNSKFPNLKLTTNKVTVGSPPAFDPVDMATLVSIRDHATEGSSIKTSWADVSKAGSWQGVSWTTTTPRKVTYLDVSYSGLTSLDVSPLKLLRVLTCYNNQLKTINVKDLPNLIGMDCSNNFLPFTQLPVSLPVSGGGYTYYPQGLLFEAKNVQVGEILDYSSEVLIDGVSTVYTWYKNNVKLENTNQTGKYTPLTEGYYYCTLTNTKFSRLTLTTNVVKVGNPPEFDPVDVIALKSIRDQAPTGSILKSIWADDKNISSWTGIDWTEKPIRRVVGLNLNSAGFVTINLGNLSAIERINLSNNSFSSLDLSGLPSLKTVNCSNNNLTSLDLSVLPALITADCSNNKLTSLNIIGLTKLESLNCSENNLRFSNLPLTLPVKNYTYYYSYQSFPEASGPVEVGKVFDYSSEVIIDGVQTKFEWFKNGVLISGTDILGKYKATEEGFYYCRMTNSKFPNLTLTTNQVKVGAAQEYYQEDVEALKAIRDNASASSALKNQWSNESQIAFWSGVTWGYTLPYRVIQLSVCNKELTQLDVSKLTALTQLSCYSNKLTAINITGLSNLQRLYCQDNLLSSIDLSTVKKLQGLDCSSNQIPFSKLPFTLPAGYGTINYSNQKPFSEEKSITLGQTIDYSSEAIIDRSSTSFTWYRNNQKIEGTDNSGKYTPVLDGFYYCSMSNSKFSGLVITTGKTTVGSAIEFNPDDVAALKSIRDNSPSDSPLRTNWADDILVKNWSGITWNSVYPLRVEKLIVSSMRLTTLDVSLLAKLKYLDCTYNKLNKLDVSSLTELSNLYCTNNQLDEIKIDNGQKINYLSCEYNRLSLSRLPLPTSTMISYRYSPQNTLYDERTINPDEPIDYSSESTIDGISTVFTWFKDNTKIENTDQTGKYTPKENGYYYCQMTNSKFVGLTITTNFLKLGTPSEYDLRDISVLKTIRDSAPETSQLKTIWSDTLPIENWPKLNWSSSKPKRVTALLLSGITLTTLDVTGLNELKSLDCSQCGLSTLKANGLSNLSSISCNDNQLSALDFSGNSKLSYIRFSNNKLPFSKMPAYISYYYTFIYSPQKEIFDTREIKLGESIDFSSEANIRGYQTNFTWYKDEVAIATIQSGTFTPTESGTYYCKMTNYAYQNLTLVTNKITVTSTSEFEVADANALKAIRNNAPANSLLKTEWADETQMATWKGVIWTENAPKRVKQLDVSNKNISSLEIGTLMALESLNCSNNLITSLNIDGLNKLNNLDCSFNLLTKISVAKAPKIQNLICNNNSIPFSALPLSLPVSAGTYKYSPMNKIDSDRTILLGESINYILESKIGGITTVFSWFKNDVKVTDSDQSGKYTPADIGIFYCIMTNDKFPGLVITTSKINIIKPEVYDLADIEALKRLRDNLPSDSPLRLKWKDDNQIFSWEGVGWGSNSPRKVNVLQMSSAGLKALDLTSFANLEQIYCDNNQLTSIKLTGLLNLNYISCAYNQLTTIDISGLPKVKNLFCQSNKLCFSKLPVKLSVIGGNYQFWPQQIVFEEQTIPLGGTIDFSSEKIINGIATVFTWYKNNNVISETDQTGKLVTSGDGFYHCVMTNANFPGLTLTTNKVNTGTIYEFDTNDVKVLTTILDNAPAISNIRSNWKDVTQIGSWYGVKWNNETPRRVTELDVSNAGLTTLDITNLDKLERLQFANNRLTSVKFTGLQHLKYINADINILTNIDLSGLSEMQLLTCPKNNLTFSSLWANKSYLNYPGAYAPQNLIYTEKTILAGQIIDYSSESKVGGITTTFTWYRNNEKIDNTDNSGKYIPTTDGYYYCSMTNSNFPDLTLFTSAVKVGTPIAYNLQDVETLKAIRSNAPESSLLKSKWGDETKIGSWEGVTWSSFYPKYVVELAIHDQIVNLDVSGLSNLQSLNICACYTLESVNISGLKKLTSIDCRYNKIPYSKLPLNTSTLSCYYNPQNDLYNELTMNLGEIIDYSSERTIDGTQTVYKWFYNGTEIKGTDQTGKYKPTSSGEYYCIMTNAKFPELTLKTNKVIIGDKIPVANAGADQVVKEGSVVYLDGTSSTSGGNENLTYLWTSPSNIILSSNTISKPAFTAPEVSTDTKFTFSLVVNNGSFSSNADQVVITVQNENKAPVANAGPNQDKNEGDTIILDGSGSYDPDGDALSYQWSSPQGILLSSTSNAKPSFKAPEVSGDTSYTFTLTVSDGKLSSVKSEVTVLIKNSYPKVKLIAKLDNSAIPATTLKYQLYAENNGVFTEVILPFEIKGDTAMVSLYAGKWAVLVSSTQSPALFVPTYFGNAITWNRAEQIVLQGNEQIIKEIDCIKAVKPINGSGEISGFIVETDKVSTKSISIFNGIVDDKKPVSGAIINLYRKGEETPVLSTVSDLNGYYKFENLQILDYDIVVEIPGFTQSDRFPAAISNATPSTSIQFAVNTNTKVITDVESIDFIKLNVYPNPVSNILYIDIEDITEKATLFIYNIKGELIYSKELMEPKTIVNFAEQTSGSYIVKVFAKNRFKQFIILKNK